MTTTLVLLTLMSNQPLVREGGRFEGRQSGRKCGDVDESMSNHGTTHIHLQTEKCKRLGVKITPVYYKSVTIQECLKKSPHQFNDK